MMKICISRMKESELIQVQKIENICFPEPWTLEQFRKELKSDLSIYYSVKFEEKVVGYVGIMLILPEAHLTTIAVHPAYQGMDIGKLLLTKAIEIAINKNMHSVTLEVRESNKQAIELYKNFYFEIVGKRIGYYSRIGEDALIMTSPYLQSDKFEKLVQKVKDDIDKKIEVIDA